jgi:hypothetical protein
LFYSNKDWLINFYLQGQSDATEKVISDYMDYTDGYAVTVELNIPISDVHGPGHQVGFCLTS